MNATSGQETAPRNRLRDIALFFAAPFYGLFYMATFGGVAMMIMWSLWRGKGDPTAEPGAQP
jgi:hypothetical protein